MSHWTQSVAIMKYGRLMRLGRETQAVYGEYYAKRTHSVGKTQIFLMTDDTRKLQNTQLRECNMFCIKNGFTTNQNNSSVKLTTMVKGINNLNVKLEILRAVIR